MRIDVENTDTDIEEGMQISPPLLCSNDIDFQSCHEIISIDLWSFEYDERLKIKKVLRCN